MSIRYVHHHVAELSGLIRVEWLEQLHPWPSEIRPQ